MLRACDPLARGLCRPPMFLMAPFDAVVVNAMCSVVLCLGIGEMLLLPVFWVPLHGLSVLVCMLEPRAFELIRQHLLVLPHSTHPLFWKGVALAPGQVSADG